MGRLAAAVLGLIVVATVIVKMRTKDGTLLVEINQPDAAVQVLSDEGKIEISQPGGTGMLSISVDPGKHRLRVEKAGFAIFTKEFSIESGGTQSIRAILESRRSDSLASTADSDRRAAEWVLNKGGTVESPRATRRFEAKALADLPNGKFTLHHVTLDGLPIQIRDEDLPEIQNIDSLNCCIPNISEQSVRCVSRLLRLTFLNLNGTDITDRGLAYFRSLRELRNLGLHDAGRITAGGVADLQKALPNCKIDWNDPAKAMSPAKPLATDSDPAFLRWEKVVAALPAEQQVDAVAKKLQQLNPGFDGKVTGEGEHDKPRIENGVVTRIAFTTANVTDISPVRALVGLKTLACPGSWGGQFTGKLSDLSPLHGLSLTTFRCTFSNVSESVSARRDAANGSRLWQYAGQQLSTVASHALRKLSCDSTSVSDLSPLEGMPLAELNCASSRVSLLSALKGTPLTTLVCNWTQVSDLSPLKGMQLTTLFCDDTPASDLSPLHGMPLTVLGCGHTTVHDLLPLKAMKLTKLYCHDTKISDFSPLEGMPLTLLECDNTLASDLSPLKGMSLTRITLTPKNITRGMDGIRQMASLEKIGVSTWDRGLPPVEFWKKYDAGEFNAAWDSPAFKNWLKEVAAQPAEKQVDADRQETAGTQSGLRWCAHAYAARSSGDWVGA